MKRIGDRGCGLLDFGPVCGRERSLPRVSSAMERMWGDVLGDVIGGAVKGESAVGDSIGDPTNGESVFGDLLIA